MVLKNGMVVFIAEDRALPLVNIALTVRAGPLPRARGQGGPGRPSPASQIRRGGTRTPHRRGSWTSASTSWPPRSRSGIGDTVGRGRPQLPGATTSTSRSRLFVEMLKEPRFQEDRLALAKEQALQEMKKRNDDAEDIESARVERPPLRRGPLHEPLHAPRPRSSPSPATTSWPSTASGFHPANMVAAVSGAFSRAEMIQQARGGLRGLAGPGAQVPPVPATIAPAAPGLYRLPEGRQPGPGLDGPAHGASATAPTSTPSR